MSATSSSDADWLRHAAALDREPELARLAVGSALHEGRYRVVRELGRGGMGVVYEAYDQEREESVAIKTLLRVSPSHLSHLKSEFRALAGISHPNLAMLHGLHCDAGRWFIAMQYVEGTTLAQRSLAAHELRPVFAQIALGLHTLHRSGRVHRDLKPSNVMISQAGRAVIVDFGLVSRPEAEPRPAHDRFSGTPRYAAPEQRAGAGVHAPADWYAFGVMLRAQLIAAQPAPEHEGLMALCQALLEVDPAQRAGARDVLDALGATLPAENLSPRGLIGRQTELAQLLAHWQVTRRGVGRSVVVRGPSGVGKTSLLAELERALRRGSHDLWWLRGACYPRETIAYNACDALVDELASHLRTLSTAECEEVWPDDSAPLVRMFPVLKGVCPGHDVEGPRRVIGDAAELRGRAFLALRQLLVRVARTRPVVIVIDDVHWGDSESAALLHAVLNGSDAPSLLALLAARSELQAEAPCLAALNELVCELSLEGLPVHDAQRAAAELLGRAADTTMCQVIARESGGNPFLLRELCRAASENELQPTTMSLGALLRRRAAQLAPTAQLLAQLVSISARPLSLPQCSAALVRSRPEERPAAAPLIDELCEAQLLSRSMLGRADVIEPYHARVRDALCAELAAEERRALHAVLAEVFEASASSDAEAVIEHLLGAGLSARAARRCVSAARDACESLSFDRAAALLQLALRVGIDDEALTRAAHIQLADVHAYTGHALRSAEAYLTAAGLVSEERLALRCRAAHQFLIGGYLARGLPLLREVTAELDIALPSDAARSARALLVQRVRLLWRRLERTPRSGPLPRAINQRLEALGLSSMGLSLFIPAQGAALGARYLAEALDQGDTLHHTLALSAECAFVGSLGTTHAVRSERAARRARALADHAGDPVVYGFIETAAAMSATARGDFRAASERCLAALAYMQRFGTRFAWERSTAQAFLGLVRFYLGDLTGLHRDLPALLLEAPKRGNLLLEAMLYGGAGTFLLLSEDRHEVVERELRRLRSVFPRDSQLLQHGWLTLANCLLHAYRGEADAVCAIAQAELPALQRSGLLRMPLLALGLWFTTGASALSATASTHGGATQALRKARHALAQIERLPTAAAPAFATTLRGLIAHANGRRLESVSALTRAHALFEDQGMAMFALAAQRQVLVWTGADAGKVAAADATLHGLGVRSVEAWCNVLLPTFERGAQHE